MPNLTPAFYPTTREPERSPMQPSNGTDIATMIAQLGTQLSEQMNSSIQGLRDEIADIRESVAVKAPTAVAEEEIAIQPEYTEDILDIEDGEEDGDDDTELSEEEIKRREKHLADRRKFMSSVHALLIQHAMSSTPWFRGSSIDPVPTAETEQSESSTAETEQPESSKPATVRTTGRGSTATLREIIRWVRRRGKKYRPELQGYNSPKDKNNWIRKAVEQLAVGHRTQKTGRFYGYARLSHGTYAISKTAADLFKSNYHEGLGDDVVIMKEYEGPASTQKRIKRRKMTDV